MRPSSDSAPRSAALRGPAQPSLATLAAFAVLCALDASCVKPSKVVGVSCGADSDCVAGSVTGTCQSTGFCSYPDPACAGGERYSPAAEGTLGNSCIGGEIPCGAMGQACCTGNVCGSDLECEAASMTCKCGEDGLVCCGGSTCSANLVCGDAARCACGAIGEPCCGGTTCDTGVTCTAGTCTAGVIDVGVGFGHVCALRSDRSVWCWGTDYRGFWEIVPNGVALFVGGRPHRVENLSDVAALGSSEFSVCARKMDGTLWCWGHGESGQLGDGTFSGRRAAAQVPGLTNVTMVEGGRFHHCAVGAYNGTQGVWCWGRGGQYGRPDLTNTPTATLGRLGNNDVVDKNTPQAVDLSAAASGGQTVRALGVGSYHSCIAMSDNTVWCWGRSGGTPANSKVPVQVDLAGVTIPVGVTIDEISVTDGNSFAGRSTCMRLSNGTAYCWGSGSQLGDNTTLSRAAPAGAVDFAALAGDVPVELTSGHTFHCVRTQSANVWCWGVGQAGVMGNGDTLENNALTPVQVTIANVVRLDLSHRTACAVDNEDRLFCWGNNHRGQILGGTDRVYTPIEVKP